MEDKDLSELERLTADHLNKPRSGAYIFNFVLIMAVCGGLFAAFREGAFMIIIPVFGITYFVKKYVF